jgi:uncharacterized protein (DUF1778 family)
VELATVRADLPQHRLSASPLVQQLIYRLLGLPQRGWGHRSSSPTADEPRSPQKQAALDKAKAEAAAVDESLASTKANIKAAAKGREDTVSSRVLIELTQPDRQKLLAELQAIREESDKLKRELAAFGAADPVRYARKKDAVEVAQRAARRWTGGFKTG